jgi:hypothetical protein
MRLSRPQPLLVEPGQSISGTHQILLTDIDAKHAHNSTVSPQFENVWEYLGTIGE